MDQFLPNLMWLIGNIEQKLMQLRSIFDKTGTEKKRKYVKENLGSGEKDIFVIIEKLQN